MEIGLMIFALAMACVAGAVVVVCVAAEMSEAWSISHLGWQRGHRVSHPAHHVR